MANATKSKANNPPLPPPLHPSPLQKKSAANEQNIKQTSINEEQIGPDDQQAVARTDAHTATIEGIDRRQHRGVKLKY